MKFALSIVLALFAYATNAANLKQDAVSAGLDILLDRADAKMPAKKLPKEVVDLIEYNAAQAGCQRSCTIGLSGIKCSKKMKKWLPGRCHTYAGDESTGQKALEMESEDWLADFGLTNENTAMEQFNAQVKPLGCSERCLKGLASIKCTGKNAIFLEWLPTRCAQFADVANSDEFQKSIEEDVKAAQG
jgi:hypothetical protein